MTLYGRNGHAEIQELPYWQPQRIKWTCPTTGRYYVKAGLVEPYYLPGNGAGTYQIQLRQVPLMPPTVVDASDGLYTNKVRVRWSAVSNANQYHVYRAESLSAPKVPLGGWGIRRSLDDISAEQGKTYYYWVRSRNAVEMSRYSRPDQGWLQVPLAK